MPAVPAVLKVKSFQRWWLGSSVSALGGWLQVVALSLLVLKLSHGSALTLGLVSLLQAVVTLLAAPVGGVLSDRLERRGLLILTQLFLSLLALGTGVLFFLKVLTLPVVFGVAGVGALLNSLDGPARAAYLRDLVSEGELASAIEVQALTMNLASTLGPAVAGLVVAQLGFGWAFVFNALSYLGVLVVLPTLRKSRRTGEAKKAGRPSLLDGFRTAWGDHGLRGTFIGYTLLLLLGPSPSLVLPLVADRMGWDAAQLGLLFAAVGAGTVLGAFLLAKQGHLKFPFRLFVLSLFLWSLGWVGFAFSPLFPLSVLALFGVGWMRNWCGTVATVLLQERSPKEKVGQVMAVNTLLVQGVRPLGDFGVAALISVFSWTVVLCLASGTVAGVAVWLGWFFVDPVEKK